MKTIQQSEERFLRRRAIKAVLAGVLVAICSLPALAAEEAAHKTAAEKENPHVWKPRVTSVAVFKEDLGFFMREGKVSLRDGWCVSWPARTSPPASMSSPGTARTARGAAWQPGSTSPWPRPPTPVKPRGWR